MATDIKTDWFRLACTFLAPTAVPPTKTAAEIDEEEEKAIAEYLKKHPNPKHGVVVFEEKEK